MGLHLIGSDDLSRKLFFNGLEHANQKCGAIGFIEFVPERRQMTQTVHCWRGWVFGRVKCARFSIKRNDPCHSGCVQEIFFRTEALTGISNLKNNNLFCVASAMSTSIRLRFRFWRIYFAEQIQWSWCGFSFSFNFNKLTTRQLVSSCHTVHTDENLFS